MREKRMLTTMLENIESGKFFNEDMFDIYVEDFLDMRDEEIFDDEWARVYDELEALEEDKISPQDAALMDKIREKSYLTVYHYTKSDEVAGRVSDDLELICKAHLLQYQDSWLEKLEQAYQEHTLPCGSFAE